VKYTRRQMIETSGLNPQKFYRRTKGLEIIPDAEGLYTEEDLIKLNKFDNFLKNIPGSSMKFFLQIYNKEK